MAIRRSWPGLLDDLGTGREPDGLCGNRDEHPAHLVSEGSLAPFWCTARQADREPGRSERRRAARPAPAPRMTRVI